MVDFGAEPFDLVVCTDVLGYLGDDDCLQAIDNIAQLTNAAAYISVLTADDLQVCDQNRTDMRQILRPADWYRQALNAHFVSVGGGLFLKEPLQAAVWQLERS